MANDWIGLNKEQPIAPFKDVRNRLCLGLRKVPPKKMLGEVGFSNMTNFL